MTDRQYLYQKYKKHRDRLKKERKNLVGSLRLINKAEIDLLDLIVADLNWLKLEKV